MLKEVNLLLHNFSFAGESNGKLRFVHNYGLGANVEVIGDEYKLEGTGSEAENLMRDFLNKSGFKETGQLKVKLNYEPLIAEGFSYEEGTGFLKVFKTHAVCYLDGNLIIYFPKEFESDSNDASRENRWRARLRKMGLPLLSYKVIVK
ncbi:MAG: hypothetical protein QXL94_05585 [Candidatus Parvarchaeum sp.]